MNENHHKHDLAKSHAHEHERGADSALGIVKLRKMVEHWIGHNEEHARSYRLWANRAREAGCEGPGEILEEIASEVVEQNKRFLKIMHIIDSESRPD